MVGLAVEDTEVTATLPVLIMVEVTRRTVEVTPAVVDGRAAAPGAVDGASGPGKQGRPPRGPCTEGTPAPTPKNKSPDCERPRRGQAKTNDFTRNFRESDDCRRRAFRVESIGDDWARSRIGFRVFNDSDSIFNASSFDSFTVMFYLTFVFTLSCVITV